MKRRRVVETVAANDSFKFSREGAFSSTTTTTTTTTEHNEHDHHPKVEQEHYERQQQRHRSSYCYDQRVDNIGIIDNVLTKEECHELIAIHESHKHIGYIDRLIVTRFADLAYPSNKDRTVATTNDNKNTGMGSLPYVLPLIRARHLCWQHVERFYDKTYELYPEFTAIMAWHKGSYLNSHYDSNRDYLSCRHYSAVLYLNDPVISSENENIIHDSKANITSVDNDEIGSQGTTRNNPILQSFTGGDLIFTFSNNVALDTKQQEQNKTNNGSSESVYQRDDDYITNEHAIQSEQELQQQHEQQSTTTNKFRITPKVGRLVCFPSSSQYIHEVEEITSGSRYTVTLWFTLNLDAMEELGSVKQQLSYYLSTTTIKKNQSIEQTSQFCLPQPWSTPEKAKRLLKDTMTNAKMISDDKSQRWMIPTFKNVTNDCKAHTGFIDLSQQELLQLISYCWWKRGVALGSLTSFNVMKELIQEWRTYLKDRMNGLVTAYTDRWKDQGMITDVTDTEMKLIL